MHSRDSTNMDVQRIIHTTNNHISFGVIKVIKTISGFQKVIITLNKLTDNNTTNMHLFRFGLK
jgi:hypothetical protein